MEEKKMPFAPEGPGGPPPEGMPGSPGGPGGPAGGKGPMARLAAEYIFDILAPSGVPTKYLHVNLDDLTATLDTEHGLQTVKDFKYDDGKFSFVAMLGSNGDEVFNVVAKLYGGGIGLGEASMEGEGTPKSPCVFREKE